MRSILQELLFLLQERSKGVLMKTKLKNTIPGIIFRNVFTYFNLIFAILAALLILAGSYRNLTFLPVVVANAVIGIVQQIRAKCVLDKLTLISEAVYEVVRDGGEDFRPVGEASIR